MRCTLTWRDAVPERADGVYAGSTVIAPLIVGKFGAFSSVAFLGSPLYVSFAAAVAFLSGAWILVAGLVCGLGSAILWVGAAVIIADASTPQTRGVNNSVYFFLYRLASLTQATSGLFMEAGLSITTLFMVFIGLSLLGVVTVVILWARQSALCCGRGSAAYDTGPDPTTHGVASALGGPAGLPMAGFGAPLPRVPITVRVTPGKGEVPAPGPVPTFMVTQARTTVSALGVPSHVRWADRRPSTAVAANVVGCAQEALLVQYQRMRTASAASYNDDSGAEGRAARTPVFPVASAEAQGEAAPGASEGAGAAAPVASECSVIRRSLI